MNKIIILFFTLISLNVSGQNFFWSHTYEGGVQVDTCYGYLYNYYVIDDSRELTSSDSWYVPSLSEWRDLADELGASGDYTSNSVGKYLKKEGTTFWNTASTGNDDYGFGAKGIGRRTYDTGTYEELKVSSFFRTTTIAAIGHRFAQLYHNTDVFFLSSTASKQDNEGNAIRLISDATGVADGVTTTYTGNDNKTYNAVAIGGIYYLTENLEETEYRNGDTIPYVTNNTTWFGLSTGALCLYNNNSNYACKTPLPTPID